MVKPCCPVVSPDFPHILCLRIHRYFLAPALLSGGTAMKPAAGTIRGSQKHGCDLPLMIRLGVRLPNMFGMIIIINQYIGICSYQLWGLKIGLLWDLPNDHDHLGIVGNMLVDMGNLMAKSDFLDMHSRHQNRQESR
jgi:hypothetical protein